MANWIDYTSKGIAQAQQALAGIAYHPAIGYSTHEKPATVLQQVARWLGTDEVTALDWLVYKVAAFRGVSEDEARRMITHE